VSQDVDHFRKADRFVVTLDGIQAADFREVKGLEVKIPVTEYHEGGLNDHRHKLPSQARYSTILLRRGTSASLELFLWVQKAMQGELEFRSGSIMALNMRDEPILVWEFRKAWPCRYEGSSFDRAKPELHIETLELGHHGFTMRRGSAGSLRGPIPSSPAQAPRASAESAAKSAAADYKAGYDARKKANWERAKAEGTRKRDFDNPEYYRNKTSAVVDTETGKVYVGQNGSPYPDPLHPALKEQMPSESQEEWPVENCAEVKAMNQMLWDREAQGRPATMDNAEMHTVNSSNGSTVAACKNCSHTYEGTGVQMTNPTSTDT
jgi:phage tail-like protein